MKKLIKKTLNFLGLFPFVDRARARYHGYKNKQRNQNFLSSHPHFIPPPVDLAFDAYHHVNWEFYYNSGFDHAQLFANLIKKHTLAKETLHVLDWGCGPARVLRHMTQLLSSFKPKICGVDYNEKTIKWCKKTFLEMDFALNSLSPPLSFTHDSFDVIYALSVFTHLSEQSHYAWLQELKRLVKPNGILILTLYGDFARTLLTENEKNDYESGKLVVRDDVQEGKRSFAALHSSKFVKETLFAEYEILEHVKSTPKGKIDQDIWVVRPK